MMLLAKFTKSHHRNIIQYLKLFHKEASWCLIMSCLPDYKRHSTVFGIHLPIVEMLCSHLCLYIISSY